MAPRGQAILVSVRATARRRLSPQEVDALRVVLRRLRTAQARLLGGALARTPVASADTGSVQRARELLIQAQHQRDDARAQLRAARSQRDALMKERTRLQQKLRRRLDNPDEDREDRGDRGGREVVAEQLRQARRQRDAAGADRTALRQQLKAVRGDLTAARAETELALNGEFATVTQFERLQRRSLGTRTSSPSGSLRQLTYGPVGVQNPVLSLLFARCPEWGLLPVPIRRIDPLAPPNLPPGSIFNLHWTRFVQLGCSSPAEAAERSDQLVAWLHELKDRDIPLVWTVHEELPHDCEFPEIEIKLRSQLAELATSVHLLQRSTIDQVTPLYHVDPAKVFLVEHPLYTGIYPDYMTREAARRMLELEEDEFTLLLFGAIRPYKGIDRLLWAVGQIRRQHPDRKVRLIIAGPAFKSLDTSQLLLRAMSMPGVTIEPRSIHSLHVQHLFRACDLVVLPYNEFLNSGVLFLALTFERPVLAADNPAVLDTLPSGLVRCFERSSDSSLLAELQRAVLEPHLLPSGPLDPTFAQRHEPSLLAGQTAACFSGLITPSGTES